ncbi:type 4b pilus protein PilO2 [Actimicrobium sp. CCC2.4]|uniref:type 4b pilus protein PilO2 n=1 Tax=Actimicrobium sp. CCC2.4 TaxID=3048606 RepID=UPI002AC8CAA9|nr:type 4b pilus protein PilO2 [Actimicrobium sp. CCC2.4]MEB0134426.1 type 4b pilus protein PilO2 [Actimicrobium sp. CCC2.4]WPX33062.1 type 4b pilus protein PilO2 [Actimicrobium sp. CCC2.4]
MSIHTLQIGKTRFVCGLFWQSLSRPRDFWKEACQLAFKIDADLVVLRKDQAMAQAGYANMKEGARRGQQSLAAVISKTIAIEGAHYDGHQQPVHNWLCAFKLPDELWAYCAVRDANFLPNGDFAGSREDVLDRLQGDYALGGWNVVIGEPELEQYGFHNFNAKTLDTLLPKRKNGQLHIRKWSSLRPVKTAIPPGIAIAAGAAGVLLVAGTSLYFFQQHQKKEQEKELAMAAARARLSAAGARQSSERPWLAKPLALDFAKACQARLDPLTAGGWQLDQFQCQVNKADYVWTSNGANVRYLLEKIPSAVLAISGTQATSTGPIELKANGKDVLLAADIVLRNLLERSQALGIVLKMAAIVPPTMAPPPVAGIPGAPAPAPKPEWKTYTLSADLGVLTPLMASPLLGQPGVRLDRISWNAGNWLIEGVVYAK